MNSLSAGLQAHVEAICTKGCTHVRQIIRQLREDRPPVELQHLDPEERRRILQELQAIMAVYDAH